MCAHIDFLIQTEACHEPDNSRNTNSFTSGTHTHMHTILYVLAHHRCLFPFMKPFVTSVLKERCDRTRFFFSCQASVTPWGRFLYPVTSNIRAVKNTLWTILYTSSNSFFVFSVCTATAIKLSNRFQNNFNFTSLIIYLYNFQGFKRLKTRQFQVYLYRTMFYLWWLKYKTEQGNWNCLNCILTELFEPFLCTLVASLWFLFYFQSRVPLYPEGGGLCMKCFLIGWNKTHLLPSSHTLSASFHKNHTEKWTLKVTEDQI